MIYLRKTNFKPCSRMGQKKYKRIVVIRKKALLVQFFIHANYEQQPHGHDNDRQNPINPEKVHFRIPLRNHKRFGRLSIRGTYREIQHSDSL